MCVFLCCIIKWSIFSVARGRLHSNDRTKQSAHKPGQPAKSAHHQQSHCNFLLTKNRIPLMIVMKSNRLWRKDLEICSNFFGQLCAVECIESVLVVNKTKHLIVAIWKLMLSIRRCWIGEQMAATTQRFPHHRICQLAQFGAHWYGHLTIDTKKRDSKMDGLGQRSQSNWHYKNNNNENGHVPSIQNWIDLMIWLNYGAQ